MSIPSGCRRPDPEIDWVLYHTPRGYPPLGADIPAVWILHDEAAEVFWDSMVDEKISCYRVVPPGHRLARYTRTGPDWYTQANDPRLSDRVVEFLREALPWPDEQVVFYAHGRRCIYRLSWAVMLRHWRRFMMIDESWIFGLGRLEFVLFADGGWLRIGHMRPTIDSIESN